jgi:6-pyruvoyltetrahydropterin/6-carboxytetrahydropterin synthase
MRYELSQKFYFEAAHTLDRAIDADGSRRIHGHTYHAEITLTGMPHPGSGMLADLGFVRQEIAKVRDLLDHKLLDEVPDLGPATLENLCRFIFMRLTDPLPGLTKVAVERQASGDRCCLLIS